MKKTRWHVTIPLAIAVLLSPTAFAQGHKDCGATEEHIRLVAKAIANEASKLGYMKAFYKERAASTGSEDVRGELLEYQTELVKLQREVHTLLDELCDCCGKQGHADCQAIKEHIRLVAKAIANEAGKLGYMKAFYKERAASTGSEDVRGELLEYQTELVKLQRELHTLLDELCDCCGKHAEHKQTAQAPTPTPSTTDKVTNVLKTISGSVSISVGGGGTIGGHDHHDRTKGEDRTRTVEKGKTSDKMHTSTERTTSTTESRRTEDHPKTTDHPHRGKKSPTPTPHE